MINDYISLMIVQDTTVSWVWWAWRLSGHISNYMRLNVSRVNVNFNTLLLQLQQLLTEGFHGKRTREFHAKPMIHFQKSETISFFLK